MNNRKREKPYPSRHAPYNSAPKRRRPLPLDAAGDDDDGIEANPKKVQTSVLVIGVPNECSVLDLKSRFEMYGPISRTRMDPTGVAYVTFRSNDAAHSAVLAARDPHFPITLHSVPVQVMWASDPVPQRRGAVVRKDGMSSKLVRPAVPLRRHGRGAKLGSAIVNPRDEINEVKRNIDGDNDDDKLSGVVSIGSSGLAGSLKGREIVAYDDIL